MPNSAPRRCSRSGSRRRRRRAAPRPTRARARGRRSRPARRAGARPPPTRRGAAAAPAADEQARPRSRARGTRRRRASPIVRSNVVALLARVRWTKRSMSACMSDAVLRNRSASASPSSASRRARSLPEPAVGDERRSAGRRSRAARRPRARTRPSRRASSGWLARQRAICARSVATPAAPGEVRIEARAVVRDHVAAHAGLLSLHLEQRRRASPRAAGTRRRCSGPRRSGRGCTPRACRSRASPRAAASRMSSASCTRRFATTAPSAAQPRPAIGAVRRPAARGAHVSRPRSRRRS